MSAREKFAIGDWVRLLAKALRADSSGAVIGFPRRRPESIVIRRDGRKVPLET